MEQEKAEVITPESFSSGVFMNSKENGVSLLEAIADECEGLQIHEEDVKPYLTPELQAHLRAECLSNNQLKERQTARKIF